MISPPHAPYADAVVGEEVEVRVFRDEENPNLLTCECTFREDTFGGQVDLDGLSRLEEMTAVDQLINGVCVLVWNELLGTPVFREDDEEWWTRVENAKVWQFTRRMPTNGWVVDADSLVEQPEADPAPAPASERDHVAAALGDADVADLKLGQDEMAALMRGEIPETLTAKLLRARSTENLISSALDACERRAQDGPAVDEEMARVAAELTEVRRRFNADRA